MTLRIPRPILYQMVIPMTNTRRPLVAGNWKMNLSVKEAQALAAEIAAYADDFDSVDLVIAPVATVLSTVHSEIEHSSLSLAAQNLHYAEKGAYTGELSPQMIKDVGCTYVILGHSERRQYFGESDELVNRKTFAALKHGLAPIVCIGETLDERKDGWMEKKLSVQVRAALSNLTPDEAKKVTIAYEPIWAIGTGETASPEQAQEVHQFLRSLIAELYSEEIAEDISILYGGSVKPNNITELISQKDIDGALVGGASLKADDFKAIASACAQ